MFVMFEDDRPSIIMLAVNTGLPLVSLVAMVALIFRHVILAWCAECRGLATFASIT